MLELHKQKKQIPVRFNRIIIQVVHSHCKLHWNKLILS